LRRGTRACLTRIRGRLVGYGSNNLIITRHPVKVILAKQSSMIYIGKQQEPVLRVNPTQMGSLNFVKVHNLKSSLVTLLRPRNSILGIGLNTQESRDSSNYSTNDYPTFSVNSSTMQLPS